MLVNPYLMVHIYYKKKNKKKHHISYGRWPIQSPHRSRRPKYTQNTTKENKR